MATDYYGTLGLARGANDDEIKRAYRSLARVHHPDVAKDKTTAEAKFKEINEAYEVLSDPEKRQNYDRFGTATPGGAGFAPEGFGDIFDMFFGQGGRAGAQQQQRPAGPVRGSDLRYDLQISLEDAFAGAERPIAFHHLATCDTCTGTGAQPGTLVNRCDRCQGSGVMRAARQTPLGQFVTQTTCTKCGGEGVTIPTPCTACRGRGRLERERTLTVKIPAGVDDGSRIRIGGSGEGGSRGGPAGDLYVYLGVAAHPRFARDGADLAIEVPIGFTTAALGGDLTIETLDGEAEVAVTAGTQSGTTFRMRGRGMPHVRGSARGDLLVRVHVVVPPKLTRKQRDVLEEFAALGGDTFEERSFFEKFKDAFRAE